MSPVPSAPASPDRPPSPHAPHGLAGTGRRYVLTVAALSGLAALPTLAAVVLGTTSIDLGAGDRSPSRPPDRPPVVVIPDPDPVPPDPRLTPPGLGRSPEPAAVRLRAMLTGRIDVVVVTAGLRPATTMSPIGLDRAESRGFRSTGPSAPGPAKSGPGQAASGQGPARNHRPSAVAWQPGQRMVGKCGPAQVPGRSMAGWSRRAGPRR